MCLIEKLFGCATAREEAALKRQVARLDREIKRLNEEVNLWQRRYSEATRTPHPAEG